VLHEPTYKLIKCLKYYSSLIVSVYSGNTVLQHNSNKNQSSQISAEYFLILIIVIYASASQDLISALNFINKRPMGHIAHLSNTGSYENIF
jgi:hypothetical protein